MRIPILNETVYTFHGRKLLTMLGIFCDFSVIWPKCIKYKTGLSFFLQLKSVKDQLKSGYKLPTEFGVRRV